ncbi:trans-sulfuration enzyme family protein [Pelosinus baikalensis]|uniref:PLP-dependent aspartate aminotransferase family protein n=1 Tax=Pelosinus baikalensis TaxID=2892015 RepID=A0ABS8HSH7_9FIRM|nr:PLP-dependent aspartate aminotransferase family protein [Pelosinus baikalensis]MCC5465188.1 PLP-dependent aspartate aminotransferase family protein [Pelosinus baikalensis]MCC5465197.1 PLP-dependent aspartate aminotransferase family protein [Pelosinus baikalensis]
MKQNSKIVHIGVCTDEKTGAISTPVYQSATFRHPALGESTGFDYTRSQNPTRKVLEEGIATLENGAVGLAFASGMAAITAILMLYKTGDHLVVVEDCYGGTYRVIDKIFSNFGLTVSFVDGSNIEEVAQSITPATKAILVETPTNPLMKIVDIRAIVKLVKGNNIQVIVDNTFLTPYFQRPLDLGADVVIHSGSKYLAGHNDLVCGLVVARDADLGASIRYIQNSTGGILGPNDSWLLIRSMKTLALRMEKHNENSQTIAQWLTRHPKVVKVYYPGLADHQGKDIHDSQSSGYGGMLSFVVDHPERVKQVLRKVQMIRFAESLGGVESLITLPAVQTHADVPIEVRERLGISDCLLRLSIGIEDANDIINDLEQALAD